MFNENAIVQNRARCWIWLAEFIFHWTIERMCLQLPLSFKAGKTMWRTNHNINTIFYQTLASLSCTNSI